MRRTITEYLEQYEKQGVIDFTVRTYKDNSGQIRFYIHPTGKDGDTLDFVPKGNELSTVYDIVLPTNDRTELEFARRVGEREDMWTQGHVSMPLTSNGIVQCCCGETFSYVFPGQMAVCSNCGRGYVFDKHCYRVEKEDLEGRK